MEAASASLGKSMSDMQNWIEQLRVTMEEQRQKIIKLETNQMTMVANELKIQRDLQLTSMQLLSSQTRESQTAEALAQEKLRVADLEAQLNAYRRIFAQEQRSGVRQITQ